MDVNKEIRDAQNFRPLKIIGQKWHFRFLVEREKRPK